MKLSKNSKIDSVIPTENWKHYDGCPVCRLMKEAAEKGKEVSSEELETAFAEAGEGSKV